MSAIEWYQLRYTVNVDIVTQLNFRAVNPWWYFRVDNFFAHLAVNPISIIIIHFFTRIIFSRTNTLCENMYCVKISTFTVISRFSSILDIKLKLSVSAIDWHQLGYSYLKIKKE